MHDTHGFRTEHPGLQHALGEQADGGLGHFGITFLQQQLGFLTTLHSLDGKQP